MSSDPTGVTTGDLQAVLADLVDGSTLTEAQAYQVFSTIMEGKAEEAQIGGLLALMQQRGVTVHELTGAARVMREYVTPVPIPDELRQSVIDTCGTGGAPKTFNVSTAAAIVAAGAGARVAKHGNRSRTGRGSAEVLQGLGVNVDAPPDIQAKCLQQAGVCFSFAIHHHPAIRYAMPARRALGFPTIFNLLGPLTNPAGAPRQLIGVYSRHLTKLLAQTLAALGSTRALVVHGMDGMDEITTTTTTQASELAEGVVSCIVLDPIGSGLVRRAELAELAVEDLEGAVRIMREVTAGVAGPALDIVLVNAAAALMVADLAHDLADGVAQAHESVGSGAADRALAALIEISNS